MITRSLVLLVGTLVLLVHDDETHVRERREQGGARANHDVRGTRADHVPLVEAFAGRKSGVEDGHIVAEAAPEAADRLSRERDLRHEDDGTPPLRTDTFDGIEVDLRLAGSRDAVDEDHVARTRLGSASNGVKRGDLPSREALGSGRGGAREARLVARPANAAPVLDGDDALTRE